MELPERKRRWEALFDNVNREDVTAWRDDFVNALRARPDPNDERPEDAVVQPPPEVTSLDVAAKALKAAPEVKAMRA
jgi:trehalose 6-phosphate synthase